MPILAKHSKNMNLEKISKMIRENQYVFGMKNGLHCIFIAALFCVVYIKHGSSKHEIVLGIIGGLFVLEALSVMVQVISFKLTGKRIFRMAPIHHHFEKKGWPESTVVIRFWIISIILTMIGLATLKLR